MGKLRKLILVITLLVVGIICLVFVLQNQQTVVLNFFTWSSPDVPVSVFILCGILLGMLIGPLLFGVRRRLRLRRKTRVIKAQSTVVQS